jgi:hypothetical protein
VRLFLILLAFASAPAAAQSAGDIDSIVVQRIIPPTGRRIPMLKWRVLRPANDSFPSVVKLLADHAFDTAPTDAAEMAALCRMPTPAAALSIIVYGPSGSRQVTVPDECKPEIPAVAARIGGLREAAEKVWYRTTTRTGGRARPSAKMRG